MSPHTSGPVSSAWRSVESGGGAGGGVGVKLGGPICERGREREWGFAPSRRRLKGVIGDRHAVWWKTCGHGNVYLVCSGSTFPWSSSLACVLLFRGLRFGAEQSSHRSSSCLAVGVPKGGGQSLAGPGRALSCSALESSERCETSNQLVGGGPSRCLVARVVNLLGGP